MRKKILLFFLSFLLTSYLFSQKKTVQEVLENTISNETLENIHFHLNKTSFTRGEHLWFAAYVQDQITQLPSQATTNLHVAIYDTAGNEVKRNLILVENGMATGDFSIDSTFVEDRYLVLGWTSYMKNFKKLAPYTQQIEIIDELNYDDVESSPEFTLETYPEGGNLIAGAFNNIGIRYADQNGKGIALSNIKLVDMQGVVITPNIATNAEGFGKVGFMVGRDKEYFLEIKPQKGKKAKIPIKISINTDIGLSINNLGKRKVITKLVLSEETISKREDVTYTLAIVQNNKIFLQEWKINDDSLTIAIERDSLPHGINTAILFDEKLNPVSWRLFFNHVVNKQRMVKMAIDHGMNTPQDSVEINLNTTDSLTVGMNLSVSVLPSNTQAYSPQNSLVSSFLINPYVNSRINSNYDVKDFDRYKNYALDVKLLVEGWGRYDWEERTNGQINADFKMESGIEVVGKILDADLQEEKQAYLMTLESKSMLFEDLKEDKSFSTNMVLYQNDSLGVSLIGKKGLLVKPRVELQIGKSLQDSGYEISALTYRANSDLKEAYDNLENDSNNLTLDGSTIALDEVVVTKKIKRDNRLELNSAKVDGRYISDVEIKKYRTVRSYLVKIGFYIGSGVVEGVGQTVVRSRARGNPIVPISIAGMDSGDGIALEMSLERVQAILHDMDRKAWIDIVPRDGHYVSPESRNKFIKSLIIKGYVRPQEYFNPRYADYSSSMFGKFGAIDWKSNVVVNNGAPTSIKVPVFNQKKLKVFIEGMGEDGSLISMEKEINLENSLRE